MTQRQQEIFLLAGMYAEGLRWLARDEYFGKYRNDLCGYREKPHKEGDAHNGERVIYWAEPRSMGSFVTSFDGLAYARKMRHERDTEDARFFQLSGVSRIECASNKI